MLLLNGAFKRGGGNDTDGMCECCRVTGGEGGDGGLFRCIRINLSLTSRGTTPYCSVLWPPSESGDHGVVTYVSKFATAPATRGDTSAADCGRGDTSDAIEVGEADGRGSITGRGVSGAGLDGDRKGEARGRGRVDVAVLWMLVSAK